MEKYRLLYKNQECNVLIDELPFGVYLEIKGEKSIINKMVQLLGLDNDKREIETYWDIYKQKQGYKKKSSR